MTGIDRQCAHRVVKRGSPPGNGQARSVGVLPSVTQSDEKGDKPSVPCCAPELRELDSLVWFRCKRMKCSIERCVFITRFDTASALPSLQKACGLWTLSCDFVHHFLLKH